jgi:hypothetical protein
VQSEWHNVQEDEPANAAISRPKIQTSIVSFDFNISSPEKNSNNIGARGSIVVEALCY